MVRRIGKRRDQVQMATWTVVDSAATAGNGREDLGCHDL
jgi:hypothetical protein